MSKDNEAHKIHLAFKNYLHNDLGITQDGLSHYVPGGWRTFSFEVATGTVPFSF